MEIFISAAEPSADLYGAALIRAVRELRTDVRFVGVAGPRMREAGCEPLYDMSAHAAMLLGAWRAARRAGDMLTAAQQCLQDRRPDAAVVIDSPTLHLPLALLAREAGVPVLYYVAPQLWAWGARRIVKLRARVDRLAVILPFEEDYFRQRGVNAAFVGHPLADVLDTQDRNPDAAAAPPAPGRPFVALLPGSRRHVVRQLLADQLRVAERIAEDLPDAAFGVSIAGDSVRGEIESRAAACAARVQCHIGAPAPLLEACDLALVASGTATLEVALRRRPMVVMYKASRLLAGAVRRGLIQTPFLSLPNILAEREIVPEFMPRYVVQEVADKTLSLLQSPIARSEMVAALDAATAPLRPIGASRNTARMLLELVERGSKV